MSWIGRQPVPAQGGVFGKAHHETRGQGAHLRQSKTRIEDDRFLLGKRLARLWNEAGLQLGFAGLALLPTHQQTGQSAPGCTDVSARRRDADPHSGEGFACGGDNVFAEASRYLGTTNSGQVTGDGTIAPG